MTGTVEPAEIDIFTNGNYGLARGLCRRYEGMQELRGMIVLLFEKAGNYRFSSLIQAALSNIERYCKHISAKALLPIVLDKSRKSCKFSRNTNEINQSDAKTDAPKTVSYPR